jgi:hypothetical protein
MSSSTYTLTLTVDAFPINIAWYVTVRSQDVFRSSNRAQYAKLKPYETIVETFSLPDDQMFYFFFESSFNGIRCQKPECYRLINQNSSDTTPLFIGDGLFQCFDQYFVGSNAPRLQAPYYRGCQYTSGNPLPNPVDRLVDKLPAIVAVLGSLVLCGIVGRYFFKRADVRRIQQDRELDAELETKIQDARKESILSILPHSVRCILFSLPSSLISFQCTLNFHFINNQQILTDHAHTSIVSDMDLNVTPRLSELQRSSCVICLDSFQIGQEVCWSYNDECRHVFHSTCILDWLFRKDDQVCPVCRNDFLILSNRS